MNTATYAKSARKKVNFMVNESLLVELNIYIPAGERSDFVNQAIEESIAQYKNRKAFEGMEKLRKKYHIHLSTKEIIKAKNYGRD